MTPGYEIASHAAAPGYAAIVEWRQGAGGRLLQWLAGGAKFNRVFNIPATAAVPWVSGSTYAHTVFVYYDRATDVATTKIRGPNNQWTEIEAFGLKGDGFPEPYLTGLAAINGGRALLTTDGAYAGGLVLFP